LATCRCQCCASTGICFGYVVCQHATRNAGSADCRPVTTDANAGSASAASRSAAASKTPLRRGQRWRALAGSSAMA
jgi:hypothetical protein